MNLNQGEIYSTGISLVYNRRQLYWFLLRFKEIVLDNPIFLIFHNRYSDIFKVSYTRYFGFLLPIFRFVQFTDTPMFSGFFSIFRFDNPVWTLFRKYLVFLFVISKRSISFQLPVLHESVTNTQYTQGQTWLGRFSSGHKFENKISLGHM